MTKEMVKDALDQLRGAVMIVYPMGLPPHDPIQMELENKEDLAGMDILELDMLTSHTHALMLHFVKCM